jgi:tRNA-modifying protein YgfZ
VTDTVVARIERDLVVVSGPDATSFLQSLVSQDLDPVAVGEAVHALLLEPRGKLIADLRAARVADDEWWCVCEPGVGAVLAAGLTRFRIRVKVEIEERPVTALAVRGPDAHALAADLDATKVSVDWPGHPGVEVLSSAGAIDDAVRALAEHGVAEIDPLAYDAWRIEAGVPRQGFDIDESTIAQEAYLDRDAVSFTKGCFVGQELVCRIDTRGHVNRLLRRLRADVPMAPGAGVEVGGKTVGTVTSAARQVALAMLRREVEPASEVLVHSANGPVTARVESLELATGASD